MIGNCTIRRSAVLAAIALVLACFHAALPANAEIKRTPQLAALVKAAEAEGVLNLVWAGNALGAAKGAAALEAALNREFNAHFKINFTPGPSMPQMGSRIIEEVKAGQKASSDIYLGVEVSIARMMPDRVLTQVPWSEYFPSITPTMQTKNHEAVLAYVTFDGFTYNTNLVSPDKVPHKSADLFRPEWKGKLASTPYAAGFDQLALGIGEDKVNVLLRKVAEWVGGLIPCGQSERIASGEYVGLFLDCGQIPPSLKVENGGPLKLALIEDALVTQMVYASVPKNSAHPNLAKLFAGFVATPEGQAVIAPFGISSPLVPGTPANRQAKDLAARGLKIIYQTPDDIAPRMELDDRIKNEEERILRGQ
jgi:ABC-type Fe3+ transport system substrate-binding protein